MFERVVAPLLTQFLGAYVKEDSFAPEKVQLGIWSGKFPIRMLPLLRNVRSVRSQDMSF